MCLGNGLSFPQNGAGRFPVLGGQENGNPHWALKSGFGLLSPLWLSEEEGPGSRLCSHGLCARCSAQPPSQGPLRPSCTRLALNSPGLGPCPWRPLCGLGRTKNTFSQQGRNYVVCVPGRRSGVRCWPRVWSGLHEPQKCASTYGVDVAGWIPVEGMLASSSYGGQSGSGLAAADDQTGRGGRAEVRW